MQTAEGALTETHKILQRMRDLSVQASNDGGLNDDAKKNIQSEIGQLKSELDRIASTTKFNGKALLDGSYNATFQVGANGGETINVAIGSTGKGLDATGLNVAGVDVTAPATGAATGTVTNASATTAGSVAVTFNGAGNFSDTTTVNDFTKLNGTISFGGKQFDLGSVEYTAAEDTNAERLTKLNAEAAKAFGLATGATPFAVGATNTELVFTAPASTTGYTDADGALSGSTTDIAKATPSFQQATGASAAIK
ncbi:MULTISPECIES: flagellin N-terminal helical domain-containing protein, partial [unclassified Modestobacter]